MSGHFSNMFTYFPEKLYKITLLNLLGGLQPSSKSAGALCGISKAFPPFSPLQIVDNGICAGRGGAGGVELKAMVLLKSFTGHSPLTKIQSVLMGA